MTLVISISSLYIKNGKLYENVNFVLISLIPFYYTFLFLYSSLRKVQTRYGYLCFKENKNDFLNLIPYLMNTLHRA